MDGTSLIFYMLLASQNDGTLGGAAASIGVLIGFAIALVVIAVEAIRTRLRARRNRVVKAKLLEAEIDCEAERALFHAQEPARRKAYCDLEVRRMLMDGSHPKFFGVVWC